MAITNNQLVNYCQKAVGAPYWYGCFGQFASKKLYDEKKKQYPQYYKWAYKYIKSRVFDCVGLIKAAVWCAGNYNTNPKYNSKQDLSANGLFNKCTKKGNIKNIPEIKGLLVHCEGHIGVYIGNGEVIEARGHAYGVVKSKLKDRNFTQYGYAPSDFVTYTSSSNNSNASTPSNTIKYYPKCAKGYRSLVDALDSVKVDSSYSFRKKIAIANGIKNYSGKPQQNIDMLNMLKVGKLKKA